MFNVGINRIILKLLLIRSNLFSLEFVISIFWQFLLLFKFYFEFALIFPFFPITIVKVGKILTKKICRLWGGGGGGGGWVNQPI